MKIIHKYKCDWKFTTINNPKPCKRRKIVHSVCSDSATACKSKPLIHPQSASKSIPILHHCVLIERWNMLTSQHPDTSPPAPPNYPLLAILNEASTTAKHEEKTSNNEHDTCLRSKCIDDSSQDTDSMSSYETAYSYFDDDTVPTMSISDAFSEQWTDTSCSQQSHSTHTQSISHSRHFYQASSHHVDNQNATNLSQRQQNAQQITTFHFEKHRIQTHSYSNYPNARHVEHESDDHHPVEYAHDYREQLKASRVGARSKDCSDYLFEFVKIVAFFGVFVMMATFQDINVIGMLCGAGYESHWLLLVAVILGVIFIYFRSRRETERDEDAFKFKYNMDDMDLPQSKQIPFNVTVNNFNFARRHHHQ